VRQFARNPKETHLKQIRKRLTYANVMSSLAVFLVLGGATAFAAQQLGNNSVGTKQLKKNAITTAKVKKNAITTAKLKANSVTGAKVKDGSLSGTDINVSTLGTVPSATKATSATSATSATTAGSLAGQTPFFVRLGFGGSQVLAAHGSVAFVATCSQEGGDDVARIFFQTSQNGAVTSGGDSFDGTDGDFLNVDTPPDQRQLVEAEIETGNVHVGGEIDRGWVIGPDGKMLTVNSEGVALGLNYGAPGCLFAGVINAVG